MKKTLITMACAGALLASLNSASAVATLKLVDVGTGSTMTVVDGTATDANGTVGTPNGIVEWSGAVGNFSVTINSGSTFLGTATMPKLTIQGTYGTTVADTLKVYWSDIGFGPLAGGNQFLATAASTGLATGSTITVLTYGDSGNTLFGNDTSHAQSSQGLATTGSSTIVAPAGGPIANPYSLTVEYDITTTLQSTTGQPQGVLANGTLEAVTVPDGGSSLILLGSALSSLGLLSLRRKQG
jgi:hypothetical protein